MRQYLNATKNPWISFLAIFPLIIAYEAAIYLNNSNGSSGSERQASVTASVKDTATLRSTLDSWLANVLKDLGIPWAQAASLFLLLVLLLWVASQPERKQQNSLWFLLGQYLESMGLALLLWAGCSLLNQPLKQLTFSLPNPGIQQHLIPLAGSGIYEEAFFRLIFFGLLYRISRWSMSNWLALLLAGVVSSIVFAIAHHIGTQGESFSKQVITIRFSFGLIFAGLFHYRGLGIAMSTHVFYNLLVGSTQ